MLIVGQHATHAPRLPLARNARRNAARFESRAIAHLWRPKAPSKKRERQLARDQLARDYERIPAAGAGYGSEREARQGAVRSRRVARAAQSLRCSMRIHQESVQVCAYRLLITARGVCVYVRRCGAVCGCVVQSQHRGSSDKCLIVIMPSGSGSGPPKPPLTRHRVSSSERAGRCDAGNARANARRAGRQVSVERVSPIDP